MKPLYLSLLGVALIVFPIVCTLSAGLMAKMLKLKINEGSCTPYNLGPWNVSNTLYKMFMMWWYLIITAPMGILLIIGGGVWYAVS